MHTNLCFTWYAMVSTRSMRSRRGEDENAAEAGDVVNSYYDAQTATADVEDVATASRGKRRAPNSGTAPRVLAENNGPSKSDGLPPKAPMKRAVRPRRAEDEKAEEPTPDAGLALHNAASIPLPGDRDPPVQDTAAPPKPRTTQAPAQPLRQQAKRTPMLSWPRCLLLLTLGTAIALAIRYRGSWEGPVRPHARVGLEHAKAVQAQIGMRLKSAEAAVRQQLPVWQRAVEGTLAEERVRAGELARGARRAVLRAWCKLRRAAGLEPKGLGVGHGHAKGCAASLDAAALDVIVAPGEQWEGLKGALRDVWGGHKEDARKGMGVLLVGGSEGATSAAALAVESALPSSCRDCLFVFKAGMPAHGDADAPGAVQELLAGFLMRCPAGVVILEGADRLHPRLLPVWINALSEQGAFEVDGRPVPAWGALYVATANMPDAAVDQADEAVLKRAAKAELTARLVAHPAAQEVPGARANAEAFRRRLDIVAPLRQ